MITFAIVPPDQNHKTCNIWISYKVLKQYNCSKQNKWFLKIVTCLESCRRRVNFMCIKTILIFFHIIRSVHHMSKVIGKFSCCCCCSLMMLPPLLVFIVVSLFHNITRVFPVDMRMANNEMCLTVHSSRHFFPYQRKQSINLAYADRIEYGIRLIQLLRIKRGEKINLWLWSRYVSLCPPKNKHQSL